MHFTDILEKYCKANAGCRYTVDETNEGLYQCISRCSKLCRCSQLTPMIAVTRLFGDGPLYGQGPDAETAARNALRMGATEAMIAGVQNISL